MVIRIKVFPPSSSLRPSSYLRPSSRSADRSGISRLGKLSVFPGEMVGDDLELNNGGTFFATDCLKRTGGGPLSINLKINCKRG